MRRIGRIADQKSGDRFLDYLLTEGIRAQLDPEDDQLGVWIRDESQLAAATDALTHFTEFPEDDRYLNRSAGAKALRKEAAKKRATATRNYREGRQAWQSGTSPSAQQIPITFALIALSVGTSLMTGFGANRQISDRLGYVSYEHVKEKDWDMTDPMDASVDVLSGEVWRVITPAFLHLGFLHLLFNMMWLHMLGGQIELRKGRTKYLLMVLVLALSSSVVQVTIAKYPFFGGMSGVVYGLFGYVWMKSRYDPADGFVISQSNINLMVIWFAICFLPGLNVANGGHAGGLALGLLMGYVSSRWKSPPKRAAN